MHGESSAKSDALVKLDHVLEDKSTFSRIRFIYQIWKSHDIIIVNGYNNYPFLLTFIINTLSPKKRFIAIESDTQLGFPRNIFKRFIKKVYLNLIFRNSYVLGYAGGSMTHKELFRYYGMEEDRIFLMPMMIDNKRYYQNSKKFPDKFTFLFVGRLLETKNVLSYEIFTENLTRVSLIEDNIQMIINGTRFLLVDLGWPIIVGSSFYAIPSFIISYLLAFRIVTSHRKIKARLYNYLNKPKSCFV